MPVITELLYSKTDKEVKTAIGNTEGNPSGFNYTIILKDTKEELYKSKDILPGMALVNFPLNKELPVGEYEVELVIDTFDINDKNTPTNGTVMETILKVVE